MQDITRMLRGCYVENCFRESLKEHQRWATLIKIKHIELTWSVLTAANVTQHLPSSFSKSSNAGILIAPTASVRPPLHCTVCITGGYLMSYWNRPYFPDWCSDDALDDSSTYDTMVRIAGSWSGVAEAFRVTE